MDSTKTAQSTDARERILLTAEHLFHNRGYAAVTLRDVAREVGIKQASLYYHFPGGKEELFAEVMRHSMELHKRQLEEATSHAPDLRAKLLSMSLWLLSQPEINMQRLIDSDLAALPADQRQPIEHAIFASLMQPFITVLQNAQASGEIAPHTPELIAGSLIGIISTVRRASRFTDTPPQVMLQEIVDVLLDGLRS